MDKEKRNIPSIIYLQANPEDEYYKLEDGPFPDDEDVTWCRDKANDNDIPYIRAEAAQRAIESIESGLPSIAKGRLLAYLDGTELADDPYLARQFLKDKLDEMDGILGGYDPDEVAMFYIDIRLIMQAVKEIQEYLNL